MSSSGLYLEKRWFIGYKEGENFIKEKEAVESVNKCEKTILFYRSYYILKCLLYIELSNFYTKMRPYYYYYYLYNIT